MAHSFLKTGSASVELQVNQDNSQIYLLFLSGLCFLIEQRKNFVVVIGKIQIILHGCTILDARARKMTDYGPSRPIHELVWASLGKPHNDLRFCRKYFQVTHRMMVIGLICKARARVATRASLGG